MQATLSLPLETLKRLPRSLPFPSRLKRLPRRIPFPSRLKRLHARYPFLPSRNVCTHATLFPFPAQTSSLYPVEACLPVVLMICKVKLLAKSINFFFDFDLSLFWSSFTCIFFTLILALLKCYLTILCTKV